MQTGIDLIRKEREEQITKHGYTPKMDSVNNVFHRFALAAMKLVAPSVLDFEMTRPIGWDAELWHKMISKPYRERLIIAGALIAAELDRIEFDENGTILPQFVFESDTEKLKKSKEVSKSLWKLLDDIDTASDVFKPTRSNVITFENFYKHVMKKADLRHKFMMSNGYEIFTLEEIKDLPNTPEVLTITDDEMCKVISSFWGEHTDKLDQTTAVTMSGQELKDFSEHLLNQLYYGKS